MFCRTQARGGLSRCIVCVRFFVSSAERWLRRSSHHIPNALLRGSGPPRRWGHFFERSSGQRPLVGADSPSGRPSPAKRSRRKHFL